MRDRRLSRIPHRPAEGSHSGRPSPSFAAKNGSRKVGRLSAYTPAGGPYGIRTRVSVTATFWLCYSVGWTALAPHERDATKTCNPPARAREPVEA
jgi:hypothetical protein